MEGARTVLAGAMSYKTLIAEERVHLGTYVATCTVCARAVPGMMLSAFASITGVAVTAVGQAPSKLQPC